MIKHASKLGAVFYILWGLLHIAGGLAIMVQATPSAQIALQATAEPPESFIGITNAAVGGIVNYHAFNLVWFGLFAIVVAVILVWKNLQLGYWLNFLVIGFVEFGLIAFMLLPGIMSWADGSVGLGLFFLALFFSSIGVVYGQYSVVPRRPLGSHQ